MERLSDLLKVIQPTTARSILKIKIFLATQGANTFVTMQSSKGNLQWETGSSSSLVCLLCTDSQSSYSLVTSMGAVFTLVLSSELGTRELMLPRGVRL